MIHNKYKYSITKAYIAHNLIYTSLTTLLCSYGCVCNSPVNKVRVASPYGIIFGIKDGK